MSAPLAVIEQFDQEQRAIISFLEEAKQISFASTSRAVFAKTLILAIASYFEVEVAAIVRQYVAGISGNHPRVCSVIERRVITRQYHTWFDWKDEDAAPFFAMFGDECKSDWKRAVREHAISEGEAAFMRLGALRNVLIHSNFAAMTIDDTPESVLAKYEKAKVFVRYVRNYFTAQSSPAAEPTDAVVGGIKGPGSPVAESPAKDIRL